MNKVCDSLSRNPEERDELTLARQTDQNQLREIMNMVRDPDIDSGFIQYDRFEKELLRMVTEQQNELIRDSEDKLLRAFRAFDPEGRRYIEPEKLKRFALNNGDKMTEEEVTDFPALSSLCALDRPTFALNPGRLAGKATSGRGRPA